MPASPLCISLLISAFSPSKIRNRHVYEAAAARVGARCVLCVAKSEYLVDASPTVSRMILF